MPKKDNTETKAEAKRRNLRERRDQQLQEARAALETLNGNLSAAHATLKRCATLSNHSGGFYEEMNKLAKGKAMLAVTDIMVEDANSIIHDAKNIVTGDVYLARVKEFVPAGENPVYPDVLVRVRSVRDSLARFHKELEGQLDSLREKMKRARTIIGALEYFLDDEGEVENQEDKNYPTKEAIANYIDGPVSNACLSRFRDSYDQYFDFEKLDQQTIAEYLSIDSSEKNGANAAADVQVAGGSEEDESITEDEEGVDEEDEDSET